MSDQDDYELASQPHDAFFKDSFSDPKLAATFFQNHLPSDIVTLVDWTSLSLIPGSFVKKTLQQTHSDLLFSAKTGGDRKLLLYLLFEHQTSVDPVMPLRLLAYQTEILLEHQSKHGLPLPPVVSYVLHQGPEQWKVSQRFEDLFQLSEEEAHILHDYIPRFQHVLLDLTQIDPEKTEEDLQLRVALNLMKLAREMQMLHFFEWLADHLGQLVQELPDPFLRKTMLYALHAESDLDVEQIALTLESSQDLQKSVMSVAEKLIAKGKAEGIAKGKAEGIAKGEAEGIAKGEAKGKAEGVWIGKIQLLEEMMETGMTSTEDLAELTLEKLESRFHDLQNQYRTKFKGE